MGTYTCKQCGITISGSFTSNEEIKKEHDWKFHTSGNKKHKRPERKK